MYAKCGDFSSARGVFDKMINKDVVTWNAMITGQVFILYSDFVLELCLIERSSFVLVANISSLNFVLSWSRFM